jgi:hypothetical protein
MVFSQDSQVAACLPGSICLASVTVSEQQLEMTHFLFKAEKMSHTTA